MNSSQIADQTEQSTTKTTEAQSSAASYTAFECLGAPSGLTLTRQEINRLILEYLVVEGYKDAAEKFSKEIGISQPLSEIHSTGASLAERMEIREAVLSRHIEETIDKLRQLQMLELIRGHRLEEALTFAQSHLAGPLSHRLSEYPQLLHEMENTMALLAFEEPGDSIYGSLLGARHAELIAGALNRAILWHIENSAGETDTTLLGATGGAAHGSCGGGGGSGGLTGLPKAAGSASSATVPPSWIYPPNSPHCNLLPSLSQLVPLLCSCLAVSYPPLLNHCHIELIMMCK
uniref:Ran binding protein 9 n=1 Tax=Echinococcus granulosus TaxID=6210 RepID=A0A068WC85_ECHGR|nr:ran binding protein 9 [Echinococcus granulosus]